MSELSIALTGYGYWGANYLRTLDRHPSVRVVVVESDARRRQAAKAAAPGVRTVASLAVLPFPVDGVIICTPPASHRDLAVEAMAAGAHVLVEKPMATTSGECHDMMIAALTNRRLLMVGHTYDYHSGVDELARRVGSGSVGSVRSLDAARLNIGGYRNDVNVMWDLAPHDIVIMRRVMDSWPSRVTAWSTDHTGNGMADLAMLRLDFDEPGTVGYIKVSWLDPVKVRRLSIVGTEQIMTFDELSTGDRPICVIDSAAEPRLGPGSQHPLPAAYDEALISKPSVVSAAPLDRQLDHFLDCIVTGAVPRTSGVEGLRVVEILEAADLSALTGAPVAVRAHDDIVVTS